ncbi:MAG: hypothetical protein ACYS8Y_01970 [Planctomycetota bacterium]|jgi:hypothetical protein
MRKRRLLALALVLITSSIVNATVIDTLTDGVGSMGHAITIPIRSTHHMMVMSLIGWI